MNIFAVSDDPVEAAQMMCDKHIPKMIVEAAQMLSTAHRMLDGNMEKRRSKSGKVMVKYYEHPNSNLESTLYKAVHFAHPCTVWTMETKQNYLWHYEHFVALCDEFEYRFNKKHATRDKLSEALRTPPSAIKDSVRTPFAIAMKAYPECIVKDPVQSYRNYYHFKQFAKWEKGRPAPHWWKGHALLAA